MRIVRVDARAAVDGAGFFASPASLLIEVWAEPAGGPGGWHTRLLAAGRPAEVGSHPAAAVPGLTTISRPEHVLIPGLVNAHCHLDLTHLGPRAHDPAAGFVSWVDMVRAGRGTDDGAIAASVREGVRLSLAAGTVAVGDIAGAPRGRPSLAPWRALRESGIRGVSFIEFFGIGRTAEAKFMELLATLDSADFDDGDPVLGIQPHAPNTVARRIFVEVAAVGVASGAPTATHLAETPEEREFVAYGRGPQREMLERFGIWDDSILEDVGGGLHPVRYLADAMPGLLAHVNDADDAAIATLARLGTTVVYCPHASEYFGAERHFGPHRYRDMLAAGINVALGTDSIVNLPAGSALMPEPDRSRLDASGMSVLREMRLLHRRDGADPVTLLRMATINGALGLGLDAVAFAIGVGKPVAGLLAVTTGNGVTVAGFDSAQEAMRRVLESDAAPEVLFADNRSGLAGICAGQIA